MPTDRAGAGGRGKDDLQHDGGGAGHASQKSKKDLDRELDKALQELVPVFRSAGDFPADGDRARRRPQGQALSAAALERMPQTGRPHPAAARPWRGGFPAHGRYDPPHEPRVFRFDTPQSGVND